MKKICVLIALLIFYTSCTSYKLTLPISGNYPPTPIVYYSNRSFDKVWDNIIDMFAQKGISIRIIDKSSGLIISDKSQLTWTFENENQQASNKDAFIVIPKIVDNINKKPFSPSAVTGDWNIRIKSDSGKTSINVNLNNIKAIYGADYYSKFTHSMMMPIDVDGKTTGVFEKTIYELVK